MATRPNPHDALFRQAFGSPKHVAGLLRLVLPKHLRAVLDLDPEKIRVLDPTHVDVELRSTGSDLVVEVPRLGAGGGPERALREHPDATHLPPVIPVVVHNGERP